MPRWKPGPRVHTTMIRHRCKDLHRKQSVPHNPPRPISVISDNRSKIESPPVLKHDSVMHLHALPSKTTEWQNIPLSRVAVRLEQGGNYRMTERARDKESERTKFLQRNHTPVTSLVLRTLTSTTCRPQWARVFDGVLRKSVRQFGPRRFTSCSRSSGYIVLCTIK
jgi:hypothetical protein